MNSYGDQQSARARARVPGPSGAPTPDDDQRYDEAPDSYRTPQARPAGGRASVSGAASVGAAPAGRASVGAAPAGRASVGSASVGSARVGARATVGRPGDEDGYARPGTPGRAAVARAAVRPTPGYNGMGELGGPSGGGPGGGGPGGGGRGDRNDPGKRAKRRRRTNVLTAAAAVLVILLGAGVVGGTYFFDDVDLPQPKTESQANTVLAADGSLLAKDGEQNRTVVPQQSISRLVEHAVAGAEDKNFYRHGGIDMKGIARAAWNNFSGGSTQGASTITQQYARHAADLKAISYNRKLREAVIARKLESNYDKEEIMGFYLNAIYFGRGAYGIEAAAQAYFGKSVTTPVGKSNAITPSEAAVLASVIKQPEPVKGGHQGYDPQYNPTDAQERWAYTLNNMVEENWITPAERAAAVYPIKTLKRPNKGSCKTCAEGKPIGMIMRHVNQELREMGITEVEQERGGLQIKTTINLKAQKAAEEAAQRSSSDSPMNGRPKTYQAAVVAIEPETGRVLAYYGGDDPNGWDFAGLNYDADGKIIGGVAPGSTFKIYTLAAGLDANISFKTRWNGDLPKVGGGKISNAGRDPGSLVCNIKFCDLEKSTVQSYNFPFYWIAEKLGPEKVVEAAKKAGLRHMWSDTDKSPLDLDKTDASKWKKTFDNEVGFGQYRVVPLEHANGVATLANGGTYHKAHFVQSVKKRDENTGKFVSRAPEKIVSDRAFPADKMSDLAGVLQKIPEHAGNALRNGRPAIGKTGTWEFKGGNGNAWMVGATPQVATAVWVGGAKDQVKLKDNDGSNMFGSDTPAAIWQKFMNAVNSELNLKVVEFPARQETGDPNSPLQNGEAPPVVEQPQTPDQGGVCIPPFCVGNGNGNGNGNNGGKPGDGQPGDGQPGDGQPGDGQPGNDPGTGVPGDGNGVDPGVGGGGGGRGNRTLPGG
jgi:membrane peptidoglycan carboxypeptidase